MLRRVPLLVVLSAVLLAGCGGGTAGPAPSQQPKLSVVATAKPPSVPVFESPGAPAPKLSLSNPNEEGAPRVFLVKAAQSGWLEVLLPVRPNGSRGWVKATDVSLGKNAFRVKIELGAHRITVWNGAEVVLQEPVGVGLATSPTPGGEYYITSLIRPRDPNGVYGVYAFGLSGFSNVYETFAGGNGSLGLHGTNDPAGLGKDVSAGCIRMSNEGITKLSSVLPLGTPVEIVA